MVHLADEYKAVKKWAIENPSDKAIIFLFFKGHSIVHNDLIKAYGISGEDIKVEGFLRDCATHENVYAIGIFDCCRRNKGGGRIVTKLSDTHNLTCIYREEMTSYEHNQCTTCNSNPEANMASEFFGHLSQKH